MTMLGRLHVDTPSIGDAMVETALVLFVQSNTHSDGYIAMGPVDSLSPAPHQLPGHCHHHIVIIL